MNKVAPIRGLMIAADLLTHTSDFPSIYDNLGELFHGQGASSALEEKLSSGGKGERMQGLQCNDTAARYKL